MTEDHIEEGGRGRGVRPWKTEDISGEEDMQLIIDEQEAQAGCVEDMPRPRGPPKLIPVSARVMSVLHAGKNKETEHLFSCAHCAKTFKRKVNLIGHLRSHKSGAKFTCAQCGEGFPKKSLLNFHVYCHNNQSYECFECGGKFKYKKNLIQHQRNHEKESSKMDSEKEVDPTNPFTAEAGYWSLKCKKCGKESRNQHDYDRHMIMHLPDTPLLSSVCDKLSSEELDLHGTTNLTGKQCDRKPKVEETLDEPDLLGVGKLMCEICDQSFCGEEELAAHMNIHDLSLHNCTICKESFTHEKSLKIHLLSHTEHDSSTDPMLGELIEDKESACEQSCSQQVTLAKSSSHKIKKTKSNEIFVCHKCGKVFSSKQSLLDHMPIHCKCRKCKKIFKNQRALDMHLIFLGDKKILPCCICGNLLHGKRELERHLSEHITEEYQLSKNSSEWEEKTKKIQTIIANLREDSSSQVPEEENIKIHKVTQAGNNSLRCSACRKIVRLHHNLEDHMQPCMESVESGEELVYISRLASPRSASRVMSKLYCKCSNSAETILVNTSESPQKRISLGKGDQQRLKNLSRLQNIKLNTLPLAESLSEEGEYSARYDPNTLIKIGREVGPDSIRSNINVLPRVDHTESDSHSPMTKESIKKEKEKEFLPAEVFIKEEWDIDLFGT